MNHKTHNELSAAYMFYYASDAISGPGGSSDAGHDGRAKGKLGERLNALVGDMLIVAKQVSCFIPGPEIRAYDAGRDLDGKE
jgi:glycylpeptide N-tetradecanoyltransferase